MYLSVADWHMYYIAIASKGQDLGDLQGKVKSMFPGMGRKKKKRGKKNIAAN